jgi:hypothetical protein
VRERGVDALRNRGLVAEGVGRGLGVGRHILWVRNNLVSMYRFDGGAARRHCGGGGV